MTSKEDIGARVMQLRRKMGASREVFARRLADAGFETTSTSIRALETASIEAINLFLLLAIARVGETTLGAIIGDESTDVLPEQPLVARFAKAAETLPSTELEPFVRAVELLARERRGKSSAA